MEISQLRKTPSARTFRAPFVLFLAFVWMFTGGCGQSPQPGILRGEENRYTVGENQSPERYDLGRDESRGGHTLSRHVARTDEQLQERLRKERNISAASTWTDRQTAEESAARAIRTERGRIESWMSRGERRANLVLHFQAGHIIGRSLRRDSSEAVPCTSAVVVLRADGPDGFYVLTTYPEARE
jgi:Bacterial CdiA-CT RNAse A domain